MKLVRFYVNGEFWKSLEVSEKEMNSAFKEYRVATKPPEEAISEIMGRRKRVYFKLNSLGNFILEDDELYLEDGSLYLKEEALEEVYL